jgi:hypothetical protein
MGLILVLDKAISLHFRSSLTFKMAFGILEPRTSHDNVPGTSYLDVHEEASVDNAQFLKKGTGRNAHVVLIPQPSDDPNDPLNWPIWQRDLILLLLTVCTLLCIGG